MTDTFSPPPSNPAYEYALKQNARNWEAELVSNPLAKLLLADAYYARLQVAYDQGDLSAVHRMDELKRKVGDLVRECDAETILKDFHCRRLIEVLYPNGGLKRLQERAHAAAERTADHAVDSAAGDHGWGDDSVVV